MKIEIELSELDQIREEARVAKAQLEELQSTLATVDPQTEHKRVCELAFTMFTEYQKRVCNELGFAHDSYAYYGTTFQGLELHLGKEPWNSLELKVTIGATVTNHYRSAFVKLGIIPKP